VLRDWDLAEVGHCLWWRGRGQSHVGGNDVLAHFFWPFHHFLHNDLVHGALEVHLNFIEDRGGLDGCTLLKVLGGEGHVDNTVDLLSVKLG
jgi:hypothetical protein